MDIVVAEPVDAAGAGRMLRREEWCTRNGGGVQHTQIEATHWSAPAHSYGKVVEGVSCVGADGRSLRARRQVEVLSARGPGLLQVLTATHTTSHSHSTTSTGFHRNFDDLQLSVNQLDVSSQKDRLSIGRSGMLSNRRPPSKVRPLLGDGTSTVSRLCHWFDADTQQQSQLAITSNGTQNSANGPTRQTIEQSKSDDVHSDKRSSSSESADTNDNDNGGAQLKKIGSVESFYDSCPEKESVFKDESEQLEEWRRASKVRRSLQYPGKSTKMTKPLDLPDNWGSVSRIKKELESQQRNSWMSKSSSKTSSASLVATMNEAFSSSLVDKISLRPENISEEPENNVNETTNTSDDNFLIKPSTLKKKSFIDTETLNELRGRLKSVATNLEKIQPLNDQDDGIETGDVKQEDGSNVERKSLVSNVRSYVYGMETLANKSSYSSGTNSLESRVSKLISNASNRSEDWYNRRKSYGFERVQNNSGQKMSNHLFSHDEKNSMESSTDSGICRSTEVVNSLNNYSALTSNQKTEIANGHHSGRGTIVTLGAPDKKESFETWLQNKRKHPSVTTYNGEESKKNDTSLKTLIAQSTNQISINLPVKQEPSEDGDSVLRLGDYFKSNSSVVSLPKRSEEFALKRHTIAIDGFKTQSNEYVTDTSIEKKNKKVEFCKTEVHFTADSGKVNIVETDGKPPSTNNFRRRRKNSNAILTKDGEKNGNLPVMHFGDSFSEGDALEKSNVEESKENLKLNYATISEIKTSKEIEQTVYCDSEVAEVLTMTNGNSEDADSEPPRGILKNKPIKPKPYHLGEDKNVLSEINNTQYSADRSVWGVKLKPIMTAKEAPLWSSSVMLKSDIHREPLEIKEANEFIKSTYGRIENVSETSIQSLMGQQSIKNQFENKGYSTKINFGNGDPIIESSYNKNALSKLSQSSECNGVSSVPKSQNVDTPLSKGNKQSVIVSKYLTNSPLSSRKETHVSDDLKAAHTIKTLMNKTTMSDSKIQETKKESSEEKEYQRTFADSISTPRSLMPTRGSARKLRDHELSYFGVTNNKNSVVNERIKPSTDRITSVAKSAVQHQTHVYKKSDETINSKTIEDKKYLRDTKPIKIESSNATKQKTENVSSSVLYENAKNKKISNDISVNRIHSGESIIDELTKAADEILQALNEYSDEEAKFTESSQRNKCVQQLATISECVALIDKTKSSKNNKAVQTVIGGTRKYNGTSSAKLSKVRTSSNSSLESLTRETKLIANKKKQIIEDQPLEKPERPQRRKTSSGDVIKARRLQRANSREALLQFHGSSSEDITGHLEVSRKKTVRRSKHGTDTMKKEDSKVSSVDHGTQSRSSDRKRESSKSSSRYMSNTMPEIRHRTTISTIMSLPEKHSKDKNEKLCSRSRHRERLREGTISSLAKDVFKVKERSRSTDTSLERENGISRDKMYCKETGIRREKSYDKSLSSESKMKKITEAVETNNERTRSAVAKKSLISTATNTSGGSSHRGSNSNRSYDRMSTGGKVTNVRTEYDKSLRLI